MAERFLPRRETPRPLRYIWRCLIAPRDGETWLARVPVYGPPRAAEIRMPNLGLEGTLLGLARRPRDDVVLRELERSEDDVEELDLAGYEPPTPRVARAEAEMRTRARVSSRR